MTKIPTWGYAANGDAQIFDLDPGEGLPRGWFDRPHGPASAPDGNEYFDLIVESEDKAALDEFAAKAGITLDRRKNFANMLVEYQAAVAK